MMQRFAVTVKGAVRLMTTEEWIELSELAVPEFSVCYLPASMMPYGEASPYDATGLDLRETEVRHDAK